MYTFLKNSPAFSVTWRAKTLSACGIQLSGEQAARTGSLLSTEERNTREPGKPLAGTSDGAIAVETV